MQVQDLRSRGETWWEISDTYFMGIKNYCLYRTFNLLEITTFIWEKTLFIFNQYFHKLLDPFYKIKNFLKYADITIFSSLRELQVYQDPQERRGWRERRGWQGKR